jgi:hypothetical protein
VHPFVVHTPAFPAQQAVSHSAAPAVVLGCDLSEAMLQLGLCQKLLEPAVFLFQLAQALGLFCLYGAVLLPPAVVGGLLATVLP